MTSGHLFVLIFEILVVLFGAWYINQINKGDIK